MLNNNINLKKVQVMKKTIISMLLLTVISLQAVHMQVIADYKKRVLPNKPIEIILNNSYGDRQDWVGIYPKGASNEWKNVLSWKYTDGIKDFGKLLLTGLSNAGEYEARLFYRNSYNVEAVVPFKVKDLNNVLIGHNKMSYSCEEHIFAYIENMPENEKDWVGVYPVDSDNTFTNAVGWMWTKGAKNIYTDISTNVRKTGEYEIRVFFNNSLKLEAKSNPFEIKKCENNKKVIFNSLFKEYYSEDKIKIKFSNVPIAFDYANWVAIYPKESSTEFLNVIQWKWIAQKRKGSLTFDPLPKGEYEARLFYNNSFKTEKIASFTVVDSDTLPTFPTSLLNRGVNPAKGVEVKYSKDKKEAYIFVNKESPYGAEHNGITRVDMSDVDNPKISAYLADVNWGKDTTYISEKNLLVYLDTNISSKLVTVDIEKFKILHKNRLISHSAFLSNLNKANSLDLFFTRENWAEQPIHRYYYLNAKGVTTSIAGINSGASDYYYIVDQGTISSSKYYITYNVRNWNRDGKWEKRKKIYDVSNLPTVKLIDTIVFEQQP